MRPAGKLAALLLAAVFLLAACGQAGGAETPETGPAADLQARFFDAGKADAILLTTRNSAVLIDAGEKGFGKTILAYLEEAGVQRLDALIVTHFDRDHVGGAAKVLEGVAVDRVYQSNRPKDSEEYDAYLRALAAAGIEPVTVREACGFTLDGVSYAIDPPRQKEYSEEKSNNSSLIVSVTNGENRFLFTGDAQTARLEEFIDSGLAACDVLKIPHHGKDEPLLPALLASARPAFAVVTSSDEEPESEAVMEALEQAGVQTLLTRRGAVTILSDGSSISVRQEDQQNGSGG